MHKRLVLDLIEVKILMISENFDDQMSLFNQNEDLKHEERVEICKRRCWIWKPAGQCWIWKTNNIVTEFETNESGRCWVWKQAEFEDKIRWLGLKTNKINSWVCKSERCEIRQLSSVVWLIRAHNLSCGINDDAVLWKCDEDCSVLWRTDVSLNTRLSLI